MFRELCCVAIFLHSCALCMRSGAEDASFAPPFATTTAAIACGGKPIMELKDLKKVAASHPALRQARAAAALSFTMLPS